MLHWPHLITDWLWLARWSTASSDQRHPKPTLYSGPSVYVVVRVDALKPGGGMSLSETTYGDSANPPFYESHVMDTKHFASRSTPIFPFINLSLRNSRSCQSLTTGPSFIVSTAAYLEQNWLTLDAASLWCE
ncbi:hypothetical protein J1614_004044 [Plenodomus biglobosus]|nr:hypothetical protein J1614_004044 [Plenodomus biglobosus]